MQHFFNVIIFLSGTSVRSSWALSWRRASETRISPTLRQDNTGMHPEIPLTGYPVEDSGLILYTGTYRFRYTDIRNQKCPDICPNKKVCPSSCGCFLWRKRCLRENSSCFLLLFFWVVEPSQKVGIREKASAPQRRVKKMYCCFRLFVGRECSTATSSCWLPGTSYLSRNVW